MKSTRMCLIALIAVLALGAALTGSMVTPAWAVSGAAFTTVDEAVDGPDRCLNGNPGVNCNIYTGKEFVWLNGGPVANNLTDGDYFFAVLVPGGQPSPNDASTVPDDGTGTPKNLSDDFDAHTNRTFTVSGGNVFVYLGTHDFDNVNDPANPKIRLMPYSDTTNPGGVYILAICSLANGYPVDPRDCKYDAFKVQEAPPQQQGEIDVFKFCDANANGILEPAELALGLQGWQIDVTNSSSCSGPTDANGLKACPNLDQDTYSVAEALQAGFKHTATCVDGPCGTGTCSLTAGVCTSNGDCPSGETCIVPPPPTDSASITITGGDVHSVDFGNVGLSTISGRKFDDRNANGVDNSEAGIAGIKVTLTGTAANGTAVSLCTVTASNGSYSFPDLLPGAYTVSEVKPAGTIATTPTSCQEQLTLDAVCGGTSQTCNFGNACLGAGGGLTLGFWSNKNGQALFGADDFAAMVALNLRNANGTAFDPTSYSQFRTWLLNANATNMAYMLSAQLAAMKLNTVNGSPFVSPSALLFAGTAPAGCTVPGLSTLGFITVGDLITAADTASNHSLATDGNTTAAGQARTCQEFMKNALDRANNNLNFVVACPTDFGATCP
jgi:SdrD B-like protein